VTIIEFHAIASSIRPTYNETFEKKSTSIQTRRRGYCPHLGLVQFTNHILQNQLHRPLTGRLLPPRTSTLAVFFWAARLLLLVFSIFGLP